MNLKIKAFLTILSVVVGLTIATYPLVSTGDSGSPKNIVFTKDNLVVINGEINAKSVSEATSSLLSLDKQAHAFGKQKPIYLYLYSPGGAIQSGIELIEATKGLKRPINTVTMFAASMAFQLVQNLGERLILENGVLMSHRAAGSFEGSFGGRPPSQLDSRYAFWLQRLRELDENTVKRTNGKQTMTSYLNSYADEMWRTGKQSISEGYADSIVTVSCDASLSGTEVHHTEFMGLNVSYETSKCPLITGVMNVTIDSGHGEVDPTVKEIIKSKFLSTFEFLGKVE